MTARIRRSVDGRTVLIVAAGILLGALVPLVRELRISAVGRFLDVDPYAAVLVASLSFLSIGSYVAWPSRWNVPAHIQLGFCMAAYVVPVCLTDTLDRFPRSLVQEYARLVALGAVAFGAGLFAARARWSRQLPRRLTALMAPRGTPDDVLSARIRRVVAISCLGLALSFALMGFVPLLAADPLTAKLFRGQYAARYLVVAPLYRFALYALAATVSLALVVWWRGRRARDLGLAIGAIALLLGGLNRDPALTGVVVFLGLVAARRPLASLGYVVFVAVAFPLVGATFFILLGGIGLENFAGVYGLPQHTSIALWDLVEAGAPDVSDHLTFLGAFAEHGHLTYGRTFVGALLPYNFPWNPGIWTLRVILPDADITDVVSGGLRLPAPIWGYTAFGSWGVVVVPLVSGYLLGTASVIASRRIGRDSLLTSGVQLALYSALGLQIARFYFLSLYTLPALVALGYIAFGVPRPLRKLARR